MNRRHEPHTSSYTQAWSKERSCQTGEHTLMGANGDRVQEQETPDEHSYCGSWSQDQLQCGEFEDQPARRIRNYEGLVHPRGDSQHILDERTRKNIVSLRQLGRKIVVHTHDGPVKSYKDEHALTS